MNMYVSNLGFSVTDSALKDLFAPYGEVSSSKVIMDRDSGRSRGFGFVEMSDETAAATAIKELNGKQMEGRALSVTEARPKEAASKRNFFR